MTLVLALSQTALPALATTAKSGLSQTIAVATLHNKLVSDPPFVVSATGGASGLPVTFSTTTPATCATGGTHGSTITLTGAAGVCTLRASQAGDGTYAPAADVDGSFRIYTEFPPATLSRVAGLGLPGLSGDTGSATSAMLNAPRDLAFDNLGRLYIADFGNHRIRRVATDGVIRTVAGTFPGFDGDGGQANQAKLTLPWGSVIDSSGSLFIADQGNARIRKVEAPANGGSIINTVVDLSAQLSSPGGLAIDGADNVYIADTLNHRILKRTPGGVISTVAGGNGAGLGGDGGPATAAQLSGPLGVAVDGDGNLYIADTENHRIRKVLPNGTIVTLAGTTAGFSGDGGAATAAQLNLPSGVAVDAVGNVYVSDIQNGRIRWIRPGGFIGTIAGTGAAGQYQEGPATSSPLGLPHGLKVDSAGNLYIADSGNHVIIKLTFPTLPPAPTAVSAVAGNGQITLDFAFENNANVNVLDFTATCGSVSQTSIFRPFVVTGLVNGTPYSCTVVARNAVGTGPASAPSASVTPQAPASYALAVSVNGMGTVSSAPAGINCPGDCTESYATDSGTVVTLTATPGSGYVFGGWSIVTGSASCLFAVTCEVSMNADATITATFVPLVTYSVFLEGAQQVPAVSTPASGSGTVTVNTVAKTLTYNFNYSGLTGSLAGAHFHGPAARGVNAGVKIDISANPSAGSLAYDTVDEADILSGKWYVNFHTSTHGGGEIRGQLDNLGAGMLNLTVGRSGTGGGTVTSAPAGINCGGDCNELYATGTVVTLSASPAQRSDFTNWSGVTCNGGSNSMATCAFTLTAHTTVTANFDTSLVVHQDFNDDARSDLLWRNTATGATQGWLMDGLNVIQVAGLLPAVFEGSFSITHVADLDGNGKADTVIRRPDGATVLWLHDGLNIVDQTVILEINSNLSIKHAADLDGDGRADLIVENANGAVGAYLMNGFTITNTGSFVPAGSGWSAVKLGDLNGDAKADIIWQHTDGTVQAWLMNGVSVIQTATFVGAGAGWSVKLVADLNGDGKSDLIWQHADGTVQAWLMNGTAVTQIASFVPAGTGWSPVLAGDIDGDGRADLFWEHADGRSQTWLMNGLTVASLAGFVGAGGWRATHLLDLNGDGKKDVLWQHSDGTVQAWLMNGLTVSQIASLAGPGSYVVVPPRQ